MTAAAPEPEGDSSQDLSTVQRFLGLVIFLLPIAGLVFHGAVFLAQSAPMATAYVQGLAVKIVFGVAFATLVGNWFHYRYTRLTLDVTGRILIYCWILSGLLLKVYWAKQMMGPAA
jgi:hypothetical protein